MAGPDPTLPSSSGYLQNILAIGEIVAGNYEILGHAGAGGMGVVYRARDLKLGRTVALKFLPADVSASDRAKERFLREARIAAALDHPNIGAIYGIDSTADGRTFIVMAFYEGPTLADRVQFGSPLKLAEIIDIARQMTRGLAAAHAQNIIHRDVKPSNVMFAGSGLVKIVDFGLAHVNEESATLTHGAAGTVGYMAPEQAMNRGVDERSDIWAVGVVLAEMLLGHNPFRRDSLPAVVLAVLNEPPESLDGVPLELQRIVYKALSKDRRKRYQTCVELLHDLDRAAADLAAPDDAPDPSPAKRSKSSPELRRSMQEASRSALNAPHVRSRNLWVGIATVVLIVAAGIVSWVLVQQRSHGLRGSEAQAASEVPDPAVLAILPYSAPRDSRLGVLGQGLVESVAGKLSALAQNRALEVIPAHNLQEKGATTLADARRVFGANLGLSVQLEPAGELVKVSYSLVNAKSNAALTSNSVTVPAADVFAVEDDVLEGTVAALRLKLRPEEQTALKIHGTTNPAAYNDYLQSRGYLVDYTKLENVDNAILMNREALKLDPNFGAAKASLGEAYWRKYSLTKDKHLTDQARNECEAAVNLGNSGPAGHVCLGLVDSGTGDYHGSAAQFQLAVQLDPSNLSAQIGLASALEHVGSVDQAESAYQHAVDTHPQSYFAYNALGGFYYRRSEYGKAAKMFQKVTELAPENYVGFVNLGGTYNDLGRYLEAIEPLKKSISLHPSYAAYTNLGTTYLALHKTNEAAAAYQEAVKLDPRQYVTWGNLGAAQYYSGAKPQAQTSYRKAIELASEELKVNPQDVELLGDLAMYESMLADRAAALRYLNEALQRGHGDKDVLATAAQVYNQLGDTGLTLEWISKAIQAGYPARKFQDLVAFTNLVDNPRYQEIVGKAQATR